MENKVAIWSRYPLVRLVVGWLGVLVQAIFIIGWLVCVQETDAFFSAYVFVGILSFLSLADNAFAALESNESDIRTPKHRQFVVQLAWALFVGFAIMMAEVPRLECQIATLGGIIQAVTIFLGAFIASWNIVKCLSVRLYGFVWHPSGRRFSLAYVFWSTFVVLVAVYAGYLVLAHFPGKMTADSCDQLRQALGMSPLANHHPVFHTFLISILFRIGRFIFTTNSSGVAFFSVCQILCVAACFSYMLSTLYKSGSSYLAIFLSTLWLAAHPYHIFFSCVMWKNVPFACCAVLFLTTLYRLLLGWRSHWEYVMLFLSALGFCLLLTNGFGAFLMSLPVLIVALWSCERMSVKILIVAACVAFVLKYPVLMLMDVKQHNAFEALSIPSQQIARVLHDGGTLSREDRELIEQLAPVEEIAKAYDSGFCDPVKWMIVKNEDRFTAQRGRYLRLWVSLGLRYPGKYIMAWIDQTKGYWNSGYFPKWLMLWPEQPDFPGIPGPQPANKWFESFCNYEKAFVSYSVLQLLLSIGLHFWIGLLVMSIAFFRLRRIWLLHVPIVCFLMTLWMSTPVCREFRYAYALFACFPLLIFGPFCVRQK